MKRRSEKSAAIGEFVYPCLSRQDTLSRSHCNRHSCLARPFFSPVSSLFQTRNIIRNPKLSRRIRNLLSAPPPLPKKTTFYRRNNPGILQSCSNRAVRIFHVFIQQTSSTSPSKKMNHTLELARIATTPSAINDLDPLARIPGALSRKDTGHGGEKRREKKIIIMGPSGRRQKDGRGRDS